MLKRFSLTNLLLAFTCVTLLCAWYTEHMHRQRETQIHADEAAKLLAEIQTLKAERNSIVSPSTLKSSISESDFDNISKNLYQALLNQKHAHQSGLIAYLGLDRYRGQIQPMITRTVWWTRSVQDQDGDRLRVFLADKHHWRKSDDGSAYIVTDDNLNLIYWKGTGILRDDTLAIVGADSSFPLKLNQIIDTSHGSMFPSSTQLSVKFDIDSVRGPRAN